MNQKCRTFTENLLPRCKIRLTAHFWSVYMYIVCTLHCITVLNWVILIKGVFYRNLEHLSRRSGCACVCAPDSPLMKLKQRAEAGDSAAVIQKRTLVTRERWTRSTQRWGENAEAKSVWCERQVLLVLLCFQKHSLPVNHVGWNAIYDIIFCNIILF